jgi:hypothetical protein
MVDFLELEVSIPKAELKCSNAGQGRRRRRRRRRGVQSKILRGKPTRCRVAPCRPAALANKRNNLPP